MSHSTGMARRFTTRVAIGSLGAVLLATLLPAAAVSARDLQFYPTYGDPCLRGYGPNRATWKIVWRDQDGSKKADRTLKADRYGSWSFCVNGSARTEEGDTMRATVGARSTALVVPRLDVTTDRVSDVVSVRTLPNANTGIFPCSSPGFGRGKCADLYMDSDGDGNATHDFSSVLNLRGGGELYVRVDTPERHIVGRWLRIPFLSLVRGRAGFSGTTDPGRDITVELGAGGGTPKGTWSGTGNVKGAFKGTFRSGAASVTVAPGDTVATVGIGSDTGWAMPPIKASVVKRTDVVAGTCRPNGPYRIKANTRGKRATMDGKAKASGRFSRDMSRKIDLRRGSTVRVLCKMATGDIVTIKKVLK